MKRFRVIIILAVILILVGVVYYRYYFVFGDGTKAGTMNYFVHKGVIFKTYEGKLIQSGYKAPAPGQGGVQSNEFMFSVTDEKVAEQLNKNSGAYLELHYKEYNHALPWRGVSEYVVDSVLAVKPFTPAQQ